MDFPTILRYTHDGFRWIVVLVTVVALVKYVIGWLGNGAFSSLDGRLIRIFNAVLGIQFVIGLVFLLWLWIGGGFVYGLGIALSHALVMIIAVGIGGVIQARIRRATNDKAKFQTGALGLLVVTLLVYVGVTLVQGWT